MSVIEIRPVRREGARSIICFAGPSGSGKTVSAILFGYGLANYEASKLGFLDTENRRGSLNDDVLPTLAKKPTNEPFLIGDLVAPFSPQRYIDAIQDFQKAGVKVLVIDSATHEWEATGGAEEIATAGNPRLPNWNRAKAEHKRFMNAVLTCDMDIVFCVRAREKAKPEKTPEGKTIYVDLGMQPIQEKNFMFEMTASLMMHDQGSRQTVIKCPERLKGILGRGTDYITDADGKAMRDWLDGAKQLDPKVEKYRNTLLSRAEQGLKFIEDCWARTPAAIQTALGDGFRAQLFKSAEGYDAQKAIARADAPQNDATGNDIMGMAEDSAAAAPEQAKPAQQQRQAAQPPAEDTKPAPQQQQAKPATQPKQEPKPQPATASAPEPEDLF